MVELCNGRGDWEAEEVDICLLQIVTSAESSTLFLLDRVEEN